MSNTYFVERSRDVMMLKVVYEETCKNFPRYKALRAPSCGCRACVEKYAEAMKAKGFKVDQVGGGDER